VIVCLWRGRLQRELAPPAGCWSWPSDHEVRVMGEAVLGFALEKRPKPLLAPPSPRRGG